MNAEEYVQRELTAGRLTVRHIAVLVEHFQDSYGLVVDGKPGPKTVAKLEKVMEQTIGIVVPVASPTRFLDCPLPVLPDGRKAVVTSGFKSVNPSRPDHNGVDFFYRWQEGDKPDFVGDKGCAGRTPEGKPKWVVPYGIPAVAAAGGRVQIAGKIGTGYRCWIDHGNGWRSGYFHLDSLFVSVGDVVYAGDELGMVGDNPKDGDARHLHFELSPVDRYAPVNPELYLR